MLPLLVVASGWVTTSVVDEASMVARAIPTPTAAQQRYQSTDFVALIVSMQSIFLALIVSAQLFLYFL